MSTGQYNSSTTGITNNRVYSDLDLKFNQHPVYKDIVPLTDVDAVKQSVRNILFTNKGERLFQPSIGSGVFDLLFEHADPLTFQAVRDNIKDILTTLEPPTTTSNLALALFVLCVLSSIRLTSPKS